MFKKVDPKLNLPEEEEKVLKFWKENKIFEKSLKKDSPKGNFVFYEGPPTANGHPGIHHVEARSFKDLFCRYKTMQGYYVKRKAGWDTHGLPVELQVEKELGISGKGQIETLVTGDKKASIEKFNNLCKESVWKFKGEWEEMTERMAYWVDMDHPYITYDANYIESIWNIMAEIDKKGLLYRGHKVVPYCTRCGTTLSSHEVAQGYKNIEEESIYIVLKSKKDPSTGFLVWTTTPWTLAGNAAIAINGRTIYYKLQITNNNPPDGRAGSQNDKFIVVAKNRVEEILKGIDYKIIEEFTGEELIKRYQTSGQDYEPIYPDGEKFAEGGEKSYKIILADYVSDSNGSGIVHIAPAFGQDDYVWGYQKNQIKVLKTVDEKGTELAGAGKGSFVKKADTEIKADLEKREILFKTEKVKHDYPFCWRCDSPLLYFARDSWYIATSKVKDDLIANNEKINWNPAYLKHGRFGNWLQNIEDWAISRDRYWGAPLPVWNCQKCTNKKVVGDFMEFNKSKNETITKLIFVRHGEAETNVKFFNSILPDKWGLTTLGKEQAKTVANDLEGEKIDTFFVSPVFRAKETAQIIESKIGIKPEEDALITEYDFGDWCEISKEERLKLEEYRRYKAITSLEEKYEFKLGGAESRKEVVARVKTFLDKVMKKYEGKTVVVVSHGGILAAIMKNIGDINLEEYDHFENVVEQGVPHIRYINSKGKLFDPHKPYIDEITFDCECGGEMIRTPEVMDVWLDSGTMPFSQTHYPFINKAVFKEQFPADFISEAVDQTRGWFWTLLAISTIVKNESPYKNVISLGHVLDEKGKKMSKSLGNIIFPMQAFDKYGADIIRYYFFSVNGPGEPKLFSDKEVTSLSRNLFLTLWNVFSFFITYASIDNFEPKENIERKNILDRWVLAKFNKLVEEVNEGLDNYDTFKPSNLIIEFVGELSTWYVRRSRRRFWKSENDSDKIEAFQTLYEIIIQLAKLLAPFTPMFAETIYSHLRTEKDPASIHLTDYPKPVKMDNLVIKEMDIARKIVEAGLSKRAGAGIKVRQPLSKLIYSGSKLNSELETIIAEEVNVKSVLNDSKISEVTLDTEISPELKMEGTAREIIRNIQSLRKKTGFEVEDRISMTYQTESKFLADTLEKFEEVISKEILAKSIKSGESKSEGTEEFTIDGEKIMIGIDRITL